MTFAVDALGWVGVGTLLYAYWLVSTQKATGESRTYQGMNLLGAMLVLVNSSYYGAYPSVGVNAAWIAIGFYALAKHRPTIADGTEPRTVPPLMERPRLAVEQCSDECLNTTAQHGSGPNSNAHD